MKLTDEERVIVDDIARHWSCILDSVDDAWARALEYVAARRKALGEAEPPGTATAAVVIAEGGEKPVAAPVAMKTEEEMRSESAPTFDSVEELKDYVNSLVEREHDYGTCVYAMSLAATAAFNFVSRRLGVTGFQASCADLDILRRTRGMDGPFVIISAQDDLYPQYDNAVKLAKCQEEWGPWLKEEAGKKLAESPNAAPRVLAHWRMLAERDGVTEEPEAPATAAGVGDDAEAADQLQPGDYVLATKFDDGDPGDHFVVGYLADPPKLARNNDRWMVVDDEGTPFRANGFRRAEKITPDEGQAILAIMPQIANVEGPSLWEHLARIRGEKTSTPATAAGNEVGADDEKPVAWGVWRDGRVSHADVNVGNLSCDMHSVVGLFLRGTPSEHAEVTRLRELLSVYVRAQDAGNSVPPYTAAEARAAAGVDAAPVGAVGDEVVGHLVEGTTRVVKCFCGDKRSADEVARAYDGTGVPLTARVVRPATDAGVGAPRGVVSDEVVAWYVECPEWPPRAMEYESDAIRLANSTTNEVWITPLVRQGSPRGVVLTEAQREAVQTARLIFAQGGEQFDHAADRARAAALEGLLDATKGGGA